MASDAQRAATYLASVAGTSAYFDTYAIAPPGGVRLPAIAMPGLVALINNDTAPLTVYPDFGQHIDDGAVDGPYTIDGESTGIFWAASPDNWCIANITGGSSGTVTSLAVATAHGLAGTVSNPTTTPVLNLSTTVTGLVKGDGTSLVAAAAGADYLAPGVTVAQGGTGAVTLAAHAVLLGEGTTAVAATTVGISGAVLAGKGAGVDPDFTTTVIRIDRSVAAITADTPSAGAVTCDLALGDAHSITMAVSTLITLANAPSAKRQTAWLAIKQGGAGTLTPTFSPAVDWGAAGTPAWSTDVGKVDRVRLDWNGTAFTGSVVGLGYAT